MLYYLSVAGILLHSFFWGAGLSWLTLPRVWRRWWWAFAPGYGVALQSAAVWAGAHSSLAGTNEYGWALEALPTVLLAGVVWRTGLAATLFRLRDLRGLAGVMVIAIVSGWVLVSPMTKLGRGLTSSSLGSCDHADYAAGARVLKEFSRDDRTGFLGQAEVTRVTSVDYFFDYCTTLNHFTPTALIAHNSTLFGTEPYRLVSVTAAALLLLNLPVVLFLARVATGLRRWGALTVTAIYGLSPLGAYAVHQGALGQLLAAQGIALVTLAGLGAYLAAERARLPGRRWRAVTAFAPLALAGFWVLAGGYNFILLVALAPAGAWMLARLALRPGRRAFLPVLAMLAATLAICAVLFWGRFAGLADRFRLFAQYNFGWPVPTLSPEGWVGLVATAELWGWSLWFRVTASVLLLGALVWTLFALWRRQAGHVAGALALALPVVAGWAILTYESTTRANASYDAYKLLSVFYPGLLAGLCFWLRLGDVGGLPARVLVAALALTVLTGNVVTADGIRRQMENPPLRVYRPLIDLAKLEREKQIDSINMTIDDFWSRLWANSFLLKKPQYFPTHTYEARLNTPLKGLWNLSDSLLRTRPVRDADFIEVNTWFFVVRRGAPGFVGAEFGAGWYSQERRGLDRWRWASDDGEIVLKNPSKTPVRARLTLKLRALKLQQLTLKIADTVVGTGVLDEQLDTLTFDELTIPPGQSSLVLVPSDPPKKTLKSDYRRLALALYGFELRASSSRPRAAAPARPPKPAEPATTPAEEAARPSPPPAREE